MPWNGPLAALAGLLLLAGCDGSAEETAAPPRPVAVTAVAALDGAERIALPGVTQAAQRAPLAFDVGGRVVEVSVSLGDRVAQGDVLARLDDTNYRLAQEQRANELAEAEAGLADAQSELRRNRELFEEGWVAEATLVSIRTRRDAAARRVDALSAALDRAAEDLADTALTAPYAGDIAARSIEPSERIAAGQPVFEIRGGSAVGEVVVQVPETVVDRLDGRATHSVRVPRFPDDPVPARLSEVSPEAARGNAFRAVLTMTRPLPLDSTGATVEVTLTLRAPDDAAGTAGAETADGEAAVTVPLTAYAPDTEGGAVVFRLDAGGDRVSAVPVTVLRLQDDRAVIAGPLAPGDTIVARGVAFLSDGMAVTVLGDGPARYNP